MEESGRLDKGPTECVLDAAIGYRGGAFCFCPIEGDVDGEYTVITGMMYVDEKPPEHLKLVGIVHDDGQEAVERFCAEHKAELEALKRRIAA